MTVSETAKIERLEQKLDDFFTAYREDREIFRETRDLAMKTNGRVTTLEKCGEDREQRLRAIESKPTRTLTIIVSAVLTCGIGVIIGAIFDFLR